MCQPLRDTVGRTLTLLSQQNSWSLWWINVALCENWPLWFISSLDTCVVVSLGCSLMPVHMWHWMGLSQEGVRLLSISVWDQRPWRLHVSHNPSVVNLVTVPLAVSKPVITMTLHLWEIQDSDLHRTHTPFPLSLSRTLIKHLFCTWMLRITPCTPVNTELSTSQETLSVCCSLACTHKHKMLWVEKK